MGPTSIEDRNFLEPSVALKTRFVLPAPAFTNPPQRAYSFDRLACHPPLRLSNWTLALPHRPADEEAYSQVCRQAFFATSAIVVIPTGKLAPALQGQNHLFQEKEQASQRFFEEIKLFLGG